nr:type I 3-dehydroquinate dehydratase [Aneurinibacillus tyrosinisolvens]
MIDTTKEIEVKGKVISNGKQPLICTPLVGKTKEVILSELEKVIIKKPDLIEWRVDFFEAISDAEAVIDVANRIKEMAGEIPLLFTRRSDKEGGEPISISEDEVVALYLAVCESKSVDFIDYELINQKKDIARLRDASAENGIKMIMSYHNFELTPEVGILNQKFAEAELQGADVAKVAVMPNNLEDVLTLLSVTLAAKNKLKIPLITMSMGKYGSLSRMFGGAFGSAVTFAVGEKSSAPGQVPIEDLKVVLDILQRAMED